MANRRYNQFQYSFHNKPVLLTCKYTVLATDPNGVTGFSSAGQVPSFSQPNPLVSTFGTGITSVTGFSSAPAAGNVTLSGNAAIRLADNYVGFFGLTAAFVSPVAGAAVNVTTGLNLGQIYQIVATGTTTTAGWQALGVPAGVTPAPGMAFQAATAAAGVGTGTVKVEQASGITSVELSGDPNATLNPTYQATGFNGGAGGWLYLNYFRTTALTQPVDGTIVLLTLLLNGR